MSKDILVETWDRKNAVCIKGRFYGWVFYKHPDGQWVTCSKATEQEISDATRKFEDNLKQESLQNINPKSKT